MQSKSLIKNSLLWITFLILLILRRPDQIFHAYVWDEDLHIIQDWAHLGLASLWVPVNGYLVTVPKLINLFAINISFNYYPEISTLFSLLFDFFVVLMVAYSPTVLGWRKLAALGVILIPTNAEVYLLPLYTLWFAGILVLISLLWQFERESKHWYWTRILLTCLGGLSSVLVVTLMPAFWLRFIFLRTKREAFIAALATLLAGIQEWFIHAWFSINPTHYTTLKLYKIIMVSVDKFFGRMFFQFTAQSTYYWILTILTIVLLLWLLIRARKRNSANYKNIWLFWLTPLLIGYAMIITIAATSIRVDLSIIDPFVAGPRYFFYPFILVLFFLCWLGAHSDKFGKIIIFLLLILAVTNVIGHYSRTHDHLNWREYVVKCLKSPSGFTFPIFFDGSAKSTWPMYLTNSECKRLARQ